MDRFRRSFAGVALAWLLAGCSSGGSDNHALPTPSGSGGTNSAGGPGSTTASTGSGATTAGTSNTAGAVTTSSTTDAATSVGGPQGPTGAGGMPSTATTDASTTTGTSSTTTGTSSTTGTVNDPEPTLVTSGEASGYWQVGAVTEGGTSATIEVSSAQTFQEWHGWGGTFNEQGWVALQALSPEERERALRLLFDANDGIGFDWGRIPIGPSDYAVARYTLSEAAGQFSIDHDQMYLLPYIHAAQAIKNDVKYWASPWTPPPWAKTGSTENMGYDKGIFNTDYYEEYADFIVSWIQAYEAEDIPINAVMPQNEPGWAQSYPTCAWGPATDSTNNTELPSPVTLGTFVDGYLFRALDDAGLDTNVWFGTLSNNKYFNDYWGDMMQKASADRIIGAALQWATQPHVGEVASAGYLVMQSEHQCGNYPWLEARANSAMDATRDNFLASMAPNNQAYGEESWDLMKSWIEDGVNIYSAWNMVLDTGGFNLDMVRPWPQNAMLTVDLDSGALTATPYYYVFRHLAQYVDVGALRIGVTGGNALAFKNPDGSIVTVLFNEATSASPTTLSVDGTLVQFEIPARGWATVNLSG